MMIMNSAWLLTEQPGLSDSQKTSGKRAHRIRANETERSLQKNIFFYNLQTTVQNKAEKQHSFFLVACPTAREECKPTTHLNPLK
jgi:hypothetical protein